MWPFNVRDESTLVFDRVQVDYEGCTYTGQGVARWHPEQGLSLDGIMRPRKGKLPQEVAIGLPRFSDQTMKRTIRFRTLGRDRGVIFLRGPLRDQLGLLHAGHLNVISSRFIHWTRDVGSLPERANGRLLFEGKPAALLPDCVRSEVHVNGRKLGDSASRGLDADIDGYEVVVKTDEKGEYSIWWHLPKEVPTHLRIGDWPRALALAWQFVNSESVWPLASEIRDGRRRVTAVARRSEVQRLGHLGLRDPTTHVTGATLIAVARLFASRRSESHVAQLLLEQCFDAVETSSLQAAMLLLGSALEATLRTLYDHPFKERKKEDKFRAKRCLKRLWKDYFAFADDWQPVMPVVEGAFERVRHRAAHPDWVRSFGGALSPKQTEATFNDLVLISRFYGYLILAMAGIQDIKPRFPVPVAKWGPMMTFSREPTEKSESSPEPADEP